MRRQAAPRAGGVRQRRTERILMTADPIGGVWTYALELIAALGTHGVAVTLATMGRPLDRRQRAAAARLRNVELRESAYKLEWMQQAWDDVDRAGEWLLGLAQECRPDVVHLNGYVHATLPWPAPVLVAAHSCVYSWFTAVRGSAPPAQWETYRRRVGAGLRGADVVVAPSAAMLRSLRRHYGRLDDSRLQVIHNGRTVPSFSPSAYKRDIIVSAGRIWDEAKNVQLLDRIAPSLPWPVWIAGEDTHPEPNGPTISCGAVRSLGQLSQRELGTVFALAPIFVSAALYEPFGLAALEAGLCGCALVLPSIESSREIWGDSALYASPLNHTEYASTLRRLIRSPRMREEYGRRARERALQLTGGAMGEAYTRLYTRTVARSRPHCSPERTRVSETEESLTA